VDKEEEEMETIALEVCTGGDKGRPLFKAQGIVLVKEAYVVTCQKIGEYAKLRNKGEGVTGRPYYPQELVIYIKDGPSLLDTWGMGEEKRSIFEKAHGQLMATTSFVILHGGEIWGKTTEFEEQIFLTVVIRFEKLSGDAALLPHLDNKDKALREALVEAPRRGHPATFKYANWKGEESTRTVVPDKIWFGTTKWHPTPQYFLRAYDLDKRAWRDFAMKDIREWANARPEEES